MDRGSEEGRRRLANTLLTRAYLEAGARLFHRESCEPAAGERFIRPLATLTRDAVLAEVANGNEGLKGTEGSFRDRWRGFPEYLSDLARFILRIKVLSPYNQLAREAAPELANGDFSAAVHEICYRVTKLVGASTSLRFRFLATALADHDEHVREAIAKVYQDFTATWSKVCAAAVHGRGLTLRPGVTFEELTTMLVATAEGLELHKVGDPDNSVLEAHERRTLFGKAALA